MLEIGSKVMYHGSITEYRGKIMVVEGYAFGRYALDDGDLGLWNVRPISITAL